MQHFAHILDFSKGGVILSDIGWNCLAIITNYLYW